jgi:hypothetical protein
VFDDWCGVTDAVMLLTDPQEPLPAAPQDAQAAATEEGDEQKAPEAPQPQPGLSLEDYLAPAEIAVEERDVAEEEQDAEDYLTPAEILRPWPGMSEGQSEAQDADEQLPEGAPQEPLPTAPQDAPEEEREAPESPVAPVPRAEDHLAREELAEEQGKPMAREGPSGDVSQQLPEGSPALPDGPSGDMGEQQLPEGLRAATAPDTANGYSDGAPTEQRSMTPGSAPASATAGSTDHTSHPASEAVGEERAASAMSEEMRTWKEAQEQEEAWAAWLAEQETAAAAAAMEAAQHTEEDTMPLWERELAPYDLPNMPADMTRAIKEDVSAAIAPIQDEVRGLTGRVKKLEETVAAAATAVAQHLAEDGELTDEGRMIKKEADEEEAWAAALEKLEKLEKTVATAAAVKAAQHAALTFITTV